MVMDASAIINPNTGKLAVSKREIKEISLQYCKETFAYNKPEMEYEAFIDEKRSVLSSSTFGPSPATFEKLIKKFKKSRKRTYDFLTKADKKIQTSMYKFCSKMFQEEKFPNKFEETVLHMIYKGKGSREILSNSRFIHCKEWLARTAEGLIVEE